MNLHSKMKRSVVQDAQVLFTTMSSSTVRRLSALNFRPDVVVVEEAGQAMECATWMCLFQVRMGARSLRPARLVTVKVAPSHGIFSVTGLDEQNGDPFPC